MESNKSPANANGAKVYVTVEAVFSPDGTLTPTAVVWEDRTRYEIDRVLDVRRAVSLKAGGSGLRYTVRIGRTETYLFLEEDRWFAVRK